MIRIGQIIVASFLVFSLGAFANIALPHPGGVSSAMSPQKTPPHIPHPNSYISNAEKNLLPHPDSYNSHVLKTNPFIETQRNNLQQLPHPDINKPSRSLPAPNHSSRDEADLMFGQNADQKLIDGIFNQAASNKKTYNITARAFTPYQQSLSIRDFSKGTKFKLNNSLNLDMPIMYNFVSKGPWSNNTLWKQSNKQRTRIGIHDAHMIGISIKLK